MPYAIVPSCQKMNILESVKYNFPRFYFQGLSILQNGKIPTFMSEDNLQKVFSGDHLGPCLAELQNGLEEMGIWQVVYYFLLQ